MHSSGGKSKSKLASSTIDYECERRCGRMFRLTENDEPKEDQMRPTLLVH